jgi:predicted ArsR family transcriptional regulator
VDGSNPGPQGLGARTRDRVRQTISEHGPITAAALTSRLGLTPAAVRRHLALLAEQSAIEEREPVRAYILSEAGHLGMDSDYDDVATSALRFLAEHAGADAVNAFARQRNAELEARYAGQLATAGPDLTARVESLATALTTDGADVADGSKPEPGGLGARTRHRVRNTISERGPIIVPALAFRLGLTPAAVRGRLHPTSWATLAHGEHVCTTFIPMSAGPGKAPKAPSLDAPNGMTISDEGSTR